MKPLLKTACCYALWFAILLPYSKAETPAKDANAESAPYRGNLQRTGCFARKGPREPREVFWTFETPPLLHDDDNESVTSPVLEGGALYVCSIQHVFRRDPATGREKWNFKIPGMVLASPAVADGMVYIGSDMGDFFYALDAETGQPRWKFTADTQTTAAVADGVVYVGCLDGCLYALDAKTGAIRWKYRGLGSDGVGSPAIADGTIYMAGSRTVHAIDPKKGRKIWQFKAKGQVFTGATVSDGKVYCGTDEGYLYGLDARTGKELWSLNTGDSIRTALAVCNGVVFFGHYDTLLAAVDGTTGQYKWKLKADIDSPPSVADGIVYYGAATGSGEGSFLCAVDAATGQSLWRFRVTEKRLYGTGSISSAPAIINGVIYVGTGNGDICAVR